MTKTTELIERLRNFEQDHKPDGWPAIQMRDVSELLNALEAQDRELVEQLVGALKQISLSRNIGSAHILSRAALTAGEAALTKVERVPLNAAQRVDIADACSVLCYDDNFLDDVGKIIDAVEAAHGIKETS